MMKTGKNDNQSIEKLQEKFNPAIHLNERFLDINNEMSDCSNQQFFNCIFVNCQFTQCNISYNDFIDCQFLDCSFHMVDLTYTGFRNTLFNECQMIGTDFSKCNKFLHKFEFSNCILDNSNFQGTVVTSARFQNCSLGNVDFTDADLTSSVFESCNLSDAKFENSILERTDFRSASNFNIDPNRNQIKDALFLDSNLSGLLLKFNIDIYESKSYTYGDSMLDWFQALSFKTWQSL